ncbi:hypothetical protein FA13DRAFT_1620243, partial [Coprinellus micaceus]
MPVNYPPPPQQIWGYGNYGPPPGFIQGPPPGWNAWVQQPRIPITPPKSYDGSPDLTKYTRFRTEFRTYALQGRIDPREQVAYISRFLDGKAYDFYLYKASAAPEEWETDEFMDELFNHCFPKDYTSKVRLEVNRMTQGLRPVAGYVHEMRSKLDIIGTTDPIARVRHLWDGFDPAIQRFLWQSQLTPDCGEWDAV